MKRFIRSLRDLMVYTDSELLEFVSAIVFIVVNPLRSQAHFVDPIWYMIGILSGIIIIAGLGIGSLKTREVGLLLALVNLTALDVISLSHNHYEAGYITQNLVVGFLWWKVSKQRLIIEVRKGCSNARK